MDRAGPCGAGLVASEGSDPHLGSSSWRAGCRSTPGRRSGHLVHTGRSGSPGGGRTPSGRPALRRRRTGPVPVPHRRDRRAPGRVPARSGTGSVGSRLADALPSTGRTSGVVGVSDTSLWVRRGSAGVPAVEHEAGGWPTARGASPRTLQWAANTEQAIHADVSCGSSAPCSGSSACSSWGSCWPGRASSNPATTSTCGRLGRATANCWRPGSAGQRPSARAAPSSRPVVALGAVPAVPAGGGRIAEPHPALPPTGRCSRRAAAVLAATWPAPPGRPGGRGQDRPAREPPGCGAAAPAPARMPAVRPVGAGMGVRLALQRGAGGPHCQSGAPSPPRPSGWPPWRCPGVLREPGPPARHALALRHDLGSVRDLLGERAGRPVRSRQPSGHRRRRPGVSVVRCLPGADRDPRRPAVGDRDGPRPRWPDHAGAHRGPPPGARQRDRAGSTDAGGRPCPHRQHGRRVGAGYAARLPRTVVGTAIFPSMGASIGLGSGAVLTAAGLRNLVPPGVPLPPFAAFLVRFRPGTSQAAGLAALASRLDPLGPFGVSGPGAADRPGEFRAGAGPADAARGLAGRACPGDHHPPAGHLGPPPPP